MSFLVDGRGMPFVHTWVIGWKEDGGASTFISTQLLIDDGGFAKYLARTQKLNSAACFCCRQGVTDDARHTLLECPTRETHRTALVDVTGPLTSLADVIAAVVGSKEA